MAAHLLFLFSYYLRYFFPSLFLLHIRPQNDQNECVSILPKGIGNREAALRSHNAREPDKRHEYERQDTGTTSICDLTVRFATSDSWRVCNKHGGWAKSCLSFCSLCSDEAVGTSDRKQQSYVTYHSDTCYNHRQSLPTLRQRSINPGLCLANPVVTSCQRKEHHCSNISNSVSIVPPTQCHDRTTCVHGNTPCLHILSLNPFIQFWNHPINIFYQQNLLTVFIASYNLHIPTTPPQPMISSGWRSVGSQQRTHRYPG